MNPFNSIMMEANQNAVKGDLSLIDSIPEVDRSSVGDQNQSYTSIQHKMKPADFFLSLSSSADFKAKERRQVTQSDENIPSQDKVEKAAIQCYTGLHNHTAG